MRFQAAMAAMARNKNHVKQFAERMCWSRERAEAALLAYADEKHFPSADELVAMCASESLQWAYMIALNAYHLQKLVAVPEQAEKLYAIIPKATIDKWKAGNAMPSARSRLKIANAFPGNNLLYGVPDECVFVYVPTNNKIKMDTRTGRIWVGDFIATLTLIGENRYAIPFEAIQLGFVETAQDAGLFFTDSGDFMRAEPAPKVFIYYAKT